ncbi:hypothetical protein JVU11DRAFT_7434 [Chiua virens]|nr:hypothetical protein JVU11DRAFT_7434 [Chiua virens]
MTSPKTFQEAESVYDRAIKLEFAAEFQPAFNLYLEAADAFIRLSRSATSSLLFQAQCKENASKALQRAEKIEKASKTPGAQIGPVAASINSFGANHQSYVLRRSSTVNDIRHPLWSEPVPPPSNPGTRYSDPNGQPTLPLSIVSNSTVVTWKRATWDPSASQALSSNLTPADIEQNIINDCSVCASISVCLQHNQRFNSNLLVSSLFFGNQPGRYDLKAYLNGDCRRVPIDNLLPFDGLGRLIGISSGRKPVVWPALIEKAYMKLMGGYDFPGSVLTGWIPEHVELQSTSFEREKTWERIANGFWKGHCVLTVGTDAKTLLKIQGVKLLPSHDYAVGRWVFRETQNERWVTLIDSRVPVSSPSLHAQYENGVLDMRWEDICATFEGIYASWNPGRFLSGTNFHEIWKPSNAKDKAQASMRHLRLLYECQNPPGRGGDPLDNSKDIWVLLTRHLSQTHRESEYISLTVQPEDEHDRRDIWMKNGDTEVKSPYTTSPHVLVRTRIGEDSTLSHAASSDSSATANISGAFTVLASYDGPFDNVFFTVNVFCGADVKVWWDENAGIGNPISPRNSGFSTKDGTLTIKNAGGNHTHPTYMLNPQWHLHIYDENSSLSGRVRFHPMARATSLRGSVASSKVAGKVPLNVTAVWSSGERIVELAQKEVVTSSGAYTYGRARAAADMAPGDYTVILSAFEPQTHLGPFTFKIESSLRFDLGAIPPEGAGLYTRVSKGEWGEYTAVGGPSHGRYHLNPIYEVQLSSSGQLGYVGLYVFSIVDVIHRRSARLHLTSPAPSAALNLSLFPACASTTSTLDRPLASSGPYSDSLSGVCIPTRTVSPGKYWLVPSTFAAGVRASFRLVLYCSDSGCVVSRRHT